MSEPQRELETHYRESHTHVPEQPFVGATMRRVAARQRRVVVLRRGLMGLGVALVAVGSPWLIRGSELLSQALDAGFTRAGEFLGTPWGIACAVAVAAFVLAARRFLQLRF
jgi:hypothetical protein